MADCLVANLADMKVDCSVDKKAAATAALLVDLMAERTAVCWDEHSVENLVARKAAELVVLLVEMMDDQSAELMAEHLVELWGNGMVGMQAGQLVY